MDIENNTAGGTTMTGLIDVFVNGSDGSTYAFGATGSIFARNSANEWTFVYDIETGQSIKGAAEYADTNGNNYLFWATDTCISRKPFPGSNSVPDTGTMRWSDVTQEWKTENIFATDWHFIKNIGGDLNIGNRYSLAQFDYDANFDPVTVNIRPGNRVTGIDEAKDYMAVFGSTRDGQDDVGDLWTWISGMTQYQQRKQLPAKGVNNILFSSEIPLCQAGINGELFYTDFTTVVPLGAIPGDGFVLPHASCIYDGIAMFGFSGATYPGIWSYGRKSKNRPQALNYEYRLMNETGATGSTSTIGAIIVTNGVLLASWQNGTTYGVDMVSSTTKADAIYEGLEFDGGRPYWKKMINTIKITMSLMPASTGVAMRFKGNKEVDWRYAVLSDGGATFSVTDATEAIFNIQKPMEIYELGIDLFPSVNNSPEVLSIISYLDGSGYEF